MQCGIFFFTYIPQLPIKIFSLMSDFELAQINTAKEKFPNAWITRCQLHYKQKVDSYKISIQYEYILDKAYTVSNLPVDDISAGFDNIERLVLKVYQEGVEHFENLSKFKAYLRSIWVPLKQVYSARLSVYNKPIRTNNTCENFHLHCARILNKRPYGFSSMNL